MTKLLDSFSLYDVSAPTIELVCYIKYASKEAVSILNDFGCAFIQDVVNVERKSKDDERQYLVKGYSFFNLKISVFVLKKMPFLSELLKLCPIEANTSPYLPSLLYFN